MSTALGSNAASFLKQPRDRTPDQMDPAVRLIQLCQGTHTLEDHTRDFLDIAYLTDLLDFALVDFYCDGLNYHFQSTLLHIGPQGLLCEFLDYVLQLKGSPFTVGEVEEDPSPKLAAGLAPPMVSKSGGPKSGGPESGGPESGGLRAFKPGGPKFDGPRGLAAISCASMCLRCTQFPCSSQDICDGYSSSRSHCVSS